MSTTQLKPELSGGRSRQRKGEKSKAAKYEPTVFRAELQKSLGEKPFAESPTEYELIAKSLDAAGNELDYKRYGEALFDLLFTGHLLGL